MTGQEHPRLESKSKKKVDTNIFRKTVFKCFAGCINHLAPSQLAVMATKIK